MTPIEQIRATLIKCRLQHEEGVMFATVRDDIEQAITLLDQLPQWKDITSAPRTSKAILVWCPEYQNTYVVCWDTHFNSWHHFGGHIRLLQEPSHWVPLPTPPTKES